MQVGQAPVAPQTTHGLTAVVAGRDLGPQGAQISGDQGVLASAGRNLLAIESRSTLDRASSQDIHGTGLDIGGTLTFPSLEGKSHFDAARTRRTGAPRRWFDSDACCRHSRDAPHARSARR